MSGAVERFKATANVEIQKMAVQTIAALDEELDRIRSRILSDLRALKAGEIDVSQIVVTDSDYEIMPKRPEIVKNGHKEAVAV